MARIAAPPYEFKSGFAAFPRLKRLADDLISLITTDPGPLTILLDGPWGAGKSTFVRQWREHFAETVGAKSCVLLDASEASFGQDAFWSLVGALHDALEPLVKRESQKDFRRRLQSAARSFIANTAQLATNGIIAAEAVKALLGDSEEHGDESDVLGRRTALSELREVIADAASELRAETGAPLVVIVDEMDRCPPRFALDLLRLTHHLFSVEGVVFILVADSAQLRAAIFREYGHEIPAPEIFIHKYVHLILRFPRTFYRLGKDLEWYENLVKEIFGRHELRLEDHYRSWIAKIAHNARAVPRDVERIAARLALSEAMSPGVSERHLLRGLYMLMVVISAMLVLKPDLYRRVEGVAYGNADPDSVWSETVEELGLDDDHAFVVALVGDCLGVPIDKPELQEIKRKIGYDPTKRLFDDHSLFGTLAAPGDLEPLRVALDQVQTFVIPEGRR